jgi:hypothetical protein
MTKRRCTLLIQLERIIALLSVSVCLLLQGCGSSSDSVTTPFAPTESPHKSAYLRYSTQPPGFNAVVGWMQAIDIKGTGISSKVEVDWLRVHATVNSMDTILLEETFDIHTSAMDSFGLYNRNPWFDGDKLALMPFTIQSSTLTLNPSLNSNRVFHWWNTSRSLIPSGTSRIWLEARVRITGGAGVQAGIDYWKDLTISYAGIDVNNTEAGASDWFGNSTTEWQIITVGHP